MNETPRINHYHCYSCGAEWDALTGSTPTRQCGCCGTRDRLGVKHLSPTEAAEAYQSFRKPVYPGPFDCA
jgi:hypothetical protein